MAAYRRVDDLPAGWLPVQRDQLRAQRSVVWESLLAYGTAKKWEVSAMFSLDIF